MAKCFILCNIDNKLSNYIVSNFAGSNMSYFLGKLVADHFDVVFVNVGAPKKEWSFSEKEHVYSNCSQKIVEFACGPSILPTRFKAKIMIKRAVNYIVNNRKENDKIIIYHSISFSKYYNRLFSIFGKNNTVIHVAELYSEVGNISYSVSKEINKLSKFSKYIFMSNGLSKRIFRSNSSKSQIFIYGVYNSSVEKQESSTDSLFHVVYAGTSSKIKGGLFVALKASEYLSNNYVVHIFCKADTSLKKAIEKHNVRYEGYVGEQELNSFISSFDIGLATQNPNLIFNNSSFPSKIVNYLSCGLNVVSSKSRSVIESPFNELMYYYDEDDSGENCASAIIEASKHINREQNRNKVETLFVQAKEQILDLLEEEL